jgi:hypothetical protein
LLCGAHKEGRRAAGLKHHPQTPHPGKQISKYTDFVDMAISKISCDLGFSLNKPLKSADDWSIGISKSIIKLSQKYVDFSFFN